MKTIKCPVCDWEIQDGGIQIEAGGKKIMVCCEDCASKVREDPGKYTGAGI